MALIIYKQRHRTINYPDTPACNYAHLRYIARRHGVVKNEGMSHGLFGKLEPWAIQQFDSWKHIASHLYQQSQEGKNVFRAVISFERNTARELGLVKQADWQRYIETHIATLAEKNGIKIQNLSFACAVHDERHHPHMHVVFWDKNQTVSKNYVHKSIPNSIRKQLIKDTFADRIRAFYSEKDAARDDIRENTGNEIAEFEQYLTSLLPKEYEKARDWFETFDEDAIYSDPIYGMFHDKTMLPIIKKLFEIKTLIPPKGRITYKLLPEEIKIEINRLVITMLKNSAGLRRAVNRYVESKMNLAKLYSGNKKYLDSQRKSFQKEAERLIANRITKTIKALCQLEKSHMLSNEEQHYFMEALMIELLELFSRLSHSNDRRFEEGSKAISTELSKQARKEKYLGMKDKGWER